MAPKKNADWKTNGTYRLTIELPAALWEDVKTWAEANGVRGSQAIRMLLTAKLRETKKAEAK